MIHPASLLSRISHPVSRIPHRDSYRPLARDRLRACTTGRGRRFSKRICSSDLGTGPRAGDGRRGPMGRATGAPAIWVLPVAFPLVMAMGGMLGLMGVPVPGIEYGIAASAILLGAAVRSKCALRSL